MGTVLFIWYLRPEFEMSLILEFLQALVAMMPVVKQSWQRESLQCAECG